LKIGPELELLLACAKSRGAQNPAAAQETGALAARLLGGPFCADDFAALAERQGLLPLAYRRLRDSSQPAARDLSKALRAKYAHNAARSIFLTSELCRVLASFEREGIDAIPYKGPALAVAAYGDASLRQFVDLDILVRPREVMRATELLAGSGFEPHFKLRSERERETFLRLSYVQLFQRAADDVAIELHWNVAPRFFNFPLRAERLWDHDGRVALGGRQVRAVAPELLVLLLCVHGNKDYWLRLEWLAAIDALSTRPGFDWPRLVEEAKRHRAARVLLVGLYLARELLGAAMPGEVNRMIDTTPAVAALADEARRMMFAQEARAPALAGQLRFHTRSKDSLRDRLTYCARLALTTTPVDWAALDVPASLSFVHALARPLRLARKYLVAPARRAS
jgi:hypothetical protein